MTGYDVIGDVHGHADALTGLLRSMGYAERDGAWRHPGRQAIFVGDLIDRGPQQLETIDIVRRMVDTGTAQVVLGNHEFNAVAYATPTEDGAPAHPQQEAPQAARGVHRRRRRGLTPASRTRRLVHDDPAVARTRRAPSRPRVLVGSATSTYLRTRSSDTNTLDPDLVVDANTGDHPAFDAIETVLKGPEVRIPDGIKFHDKGNHTRTNVRLTWWNDSVTNWRDLLPPGTKILDADDTRIGALPDTPIPDHLSKRYDGDVPVIFGHYWFEEPLVLTNPLALCVDYSAGAGGPLAAYRFDGETRLSADNLVSY